MSQNNAIVVGFAADMFVMTINFTCFFGYASSPIPEECARSTSEFQVRRNVDKLSTWVSSGPDAGIRVAHASCRRLNLDRRELIANASARQLRHSCRRQARVKSLFFAVGYIFLPTHPSWWTENFHLYCGWSVWGDDIFSHPNWPLCSRVCGRIIKKGVW